MKSVRISALLAVMALLVATPAAYAVSDEDRLVRERLVAQLTNPSPVISRSAVDRLADLGPAVMPDVAVLASDPDPLVRGRVAVVAGRVGGTRAGEMLSRMSQDRSDYVREVSALGLGAVRPRGALIHLQRLLTDPLPGVREAAALAMGTLGDPQAIPTLARWQNAGGERESLRIHEGVTGRNQVVKIQRAMRASLGRVVAQPQALDRVSEFLTSLDGSALQAVVEVTWEIGDPRLCPALVGVIERGDPVSRRLAATSLAANGDGRALELLCQVAARGRDPELRDAAATTLRRLTGHDAAAGDAWSLWWQTNGERVRGLYPRDELIARLHHPGHTPTAAELAPFSPNELAGLIDGTIGIGAPWWPRQAWRALQADDPTRWTEYLLQRYDRTYDEGLQVALVVVLDELDDPAAQPGLHERLAEVEALAPEDPDLAPHPNGSLRAALRLATGHGFGRL